jgi:hypothetical protein
LNTRDYILRNVELQYIQLTHCDIAKMTKDLTPVFAAYQQHGIERFEGPPYARYFEALSREHLIELKETLWQVESNIRQSGGEGH